MTEAKMVIDGKEVRYVAEDDDRELIDSAEQIPAFASESEEQAWWHTHALSERFWREAELVPADKLPPVRSAADAAEDDPLPVRRGRLSGGQIAAIALVGGLLALSAGYLAYELIKGRPAAPGFLPTWVPYLSVSPPPLAAVVREISSISRIASS